ncbi:MAG TPA: DUF423 domain-containing protein, partial [Isosphaeraceae bacterium]|nr:DUF423 domain-containing protein [Isosphaeraceae bacterium]
MNAAFWFRTGAILSLIGVAAGTFGAHGLESLLPTSNGTRLPEGILSAERRLVDFKIGVDYQLTHALALLALGLAASRLPRPGRAATVAGWSFIFGIVVFSGSLYAIGLTGIARLGMITPIGGAAFFVGWISLAMMA